MNSKGPMLKKNTKSEKRVRGYVHYVIQRGGTENELYVHGFDKIREAEKYRIDCRDDASYETSEIVSFPKRLANQRGFENALQDIVSSIRTIEYV